MITPIFTSCAVIAWVLIIAGIATQARHFAFVYRPTTRHEVMAQILVLVPLALVLGALLSTTHKVSLAVDWQAYYYYHALVIDALRQGELPGWVSALSGGFPFAGHPESPSLGIFTLFPFLLGAEEGVRVNIALFELLLTLGTLLVARGGMKLAPLPAAAMTAFVVSSVLMAARLFTQKYTNFFEFLIPLAVWLALIATNQGRPFVRALCLCAAAILFAAILNQGKICFVSAVMIQAGIAVRQIWRHWPRRLEIIVLYTVLGALILLLAAPKLLPMIELLQRDHRYVNDWTTVSADHVFTLRKLAMALTTQKYDEIRWVGGNKMIGLGLGVLLLGFLGLARKPVAAWPWAVAALVAMLAGLGDNGPIPLGFWLWHLPAWHSMTDLDKYFGFFIMFTLTAIAAVGVDWLGERYGWKIASATVVLILAVLLPETITANRAAFPSTPQQPLREPDFYYTARAGRHGLLVTDYTLYLRGLGTVDGYINVKLPTGVQPRFFMDANGRTQPNPQWRGEAFVIDGEGEASVIARAQSELTVRATTSGPAIIVVNQTDDRHWQAIGAELVPDGSHVLRLSVDGAGEHVITLRNRDPNVARGAVIGLMALALMLAGVATTRMREKRS